MKTGIQLYEEGNRNLVLMNIMPLLVITFQHVFTELSTTGTLFQEKLRIESIFLF